jgi:hypothetical protein
MTTSSLNVSAVRSRARRIGFDVRKSRRSISANNFGEYMLVDDLNRVVLGSNYDATIEDIAGYIDA